jgi:hypothetical protein
VDTDRRGFLRMTAGATALLWPLRSAGAREAGAQTAGIMSFAAQFGSNPGD